MRDMTRFDAERLKSLIDKHVHYTGSARGRRVLESWDDYLPQFVKVMPVDYYRALKEMELTQPAEPAALLVESR